MTKEEYKRYLLSDHWQKVRRVMMGIKPNPKCSLCGVHDTELHVHHVNYSNIGAEKYDDIVVLCAQCHNMAHATNKEIVLIESDARKAYFNKMFYFMYTYNMTREEAIPYVDDYMRESHSSADFLSTVGDVAKRMLDVYANNQGKMIITR